jgi:hypothetical protein
MGTPLRLRTEGSGAAAILRRPGAAVQYRCTGTVICKSYHVQEGGQPDAKIAKVSQKSQKDFPSFLMDSFASLGYSTFATFASGRPLPLPFTAAA